MPSLQEILSHKSFTQATLSKNASRVRREGRQSRRGGHGRDHVVWAPPRQEGGRAQEYLGTTNILLCQALRKT